MNLVTEYLVIIEKKATDGLFHLCDSVEEFTRLLQKDRDIVIDGEAVRYKRTLDCAYHVTAGEVEGREQRFFYLRVVWEGAKDRTEDYAALLRRIRQILGTARARVETLRDDVSLHYSQRAYPLIHHTENLMRKLITYFMITNVGVDWVSEAAPTDFQTAIEKSKRREYRDILHQVDFAHLGNLLFSSYQRGRTDELYQILEEARDLSDLSLDELRDFVPRSNWERYFAKVVECDADYLKKKWEQLYDLRCKVAHNALVTKTDYDRIQRLVSEVEEPLQKAVDKLSEVHVPEEERETVAENVISSIDALFGEFIRLWKSFEEALHYYAQVSGIAALYSTEGKSLGQVLQILHSDGAIDDDMLQEATELSRLRNFLVHQPGAAFNAQQIQSYIDWLRRLIDALQMTWNEEIYAAVRDLGGSAHLSQIYDYIQEHSLRTLPETWRATVRYTLQRNSSDTETFKRGGEDLFVQLGDGFWALRDPVGYEAAAQLYTDPNHSHQTEE